MIVLVEQMLKLWSWKSHGILKSSQNTNPELRINDCLSYLFVGDNIIGRDGKCNITVPIKVSIQYF